MTAVDPPKMPFWDKWRGRIGAGCSFTRRLDPAANPLRFQITRSQLFKLIKTRQSVISLMPEHDSLMATLAKSPRLQYFGLDSCSHLGIADFGRPAQEIIQIGIYFKASMVIVLREFDLKIGK